jgi:PEP-CTERM motif
MIFIKGSASLGAAILIGLSAPPARAGYVVDLTQQGSNVVATGSGPIDLTGLTFFSSLGAPSSLINPGEGFILTGPAPILGDQYTGITGPTSFGGGSIAFAASGSGDEVGILFEKLVVPVGYSGTALSDTATYGSQTFSSLGVTPGTYKWTWGTGANQNFTLVIGAAAVPEPSTWAMMLLGFAGLSYAGWRTQRKSAELAA